MSRKRLIEIKCRKIVGGKAKGQVLITTQPLNMLSMIDNVSGLIKDENHELFKKTLKNRILIFPNSVGSSVGAYVFYSLKENGVNPLAIICTHKCDTITASGCAISDIPLVDNLNLNLELMIDSDVEIFLDADKEKIIVNKV